MNHPAARGGTGAFAPFEWLLAFRYLRARKKGSVSVIAVFAVIGIMLGVATLIIVLSVLNGFRKDLFDKILGLNGHVIVRPLARSFTDYNETAERLKAAGWRQVRPCRDRRPGDDLLESELLRHPGARPAGPRPECAANHFRQFAFRFVREFRLVWGHRHRFALGQHAQRRCRRRGVGLGSHGFARSFGAA